MALSKKDRREKQELQRKEIWEEAREARREEREAVREAREEQREEKREATATKLARTVTPGTGVVVDTDPTVLTDIRIGEIVRVKPLLVELLDGSVVRVDARAGKHTLTTGVLVLLLVTGGWHILAGIVEVY